MNPGARLYFAVCLRLGRFLRAGRYSEVRFTSESGQAEVRKRRRFYAPFLVALSRPMFRVLGTGMHVLSHHAWIERERELYARLQRAPVRVEDGTLMLPPLPGETLSSLLADPTLCTTDRAQAIALAARGLARLHEMDITHGDAMADNVLVDLSAGVAHWFDFETVHDSDRPPPWRRADDLRALLMTSLGRTRESAFDEVFDAIIAAYRDDEAWTTLSEHFARGLPRPLAFHLGQAPLSAAAYHAMVQILTERFRPSMSSHRGAQG